MQRLMGPILTSLCIVGRWWWSPSPLRHGTDTAIVDYLMPKKTAARVRSASDDPLRWTRRQGVHGQTSACVEGRHDSSSGEGCGGGWRGQRAMRTEDEGSTQRSMVPSSSKLTTLFDCASIDKCGILRSFRSPMFASGSARGGAQG